MVQVTRNNIVLAESDRTVIVEGNHYFPPQDVQTDKLQSSETHTNCPWKGTASYYTFANDDDVVKDIAWYYPEPYDKANHIKGYIAFYKNKVDFNE